MKKLVLISAIVSGIVFANSQAAKAQLGIRVNLNFGHAPVYVAPAPAPVAVADFYYLPDVEAYYSVRANLYYYFDGNCWVSAAFLPGRFHDYRWDTCRHFAVNEAQPYMHHDVYRARFGGMPQGNYYQNNYAAARPEYRENYNRGNNYYNQGNYYRRDNDRHEDRDHDRGNHDGRRW